MEGRKIALLLVEDDEIDRFAFERFLKREGLAYDCSIVGSVREADDILGNGDFDVVVSDYNLGDGTALDIFGREKDAAIVVITGAGNEEIAVQAMKSGAHDYLIKDLEGNYLKTLPVTIDRAIRQKQAELELERYRNHLETLVEERSGALRESEKRLTALITRLPQGVCMLDGDRRIVMTNPASRQYLSVLAGRREGDVLERLGTLALDEVLTGTPAGLKHDVTVAGPPARVFEADGRPMGGGRPSDGWVLTLEDVTREREAQDRMQQQDRLAAVGQLAAGISHDFNNLLSVVTGLSQLMARRKDVPEWVREDATSISTQGQRAAQLIRQILDFSRQTEADRRPMDLVPFVKESVKLLRRTLPETVRMVTAFDVQGCMVEGNVTQLQQVLTNLSLNARDAMQEGGTLEIGLALFRLREGERPPGPDMAPGDWAVWTVSDTGCGMTPEVLSHIHEPFFTTKERGEGTGLGLAQVYGIVKQHGGEIDVSSAEGQGTRFAVYLPVIRAEEGVAQEEGEVPEGRGETILVVEDDASVSAMVKDMLVQLNYRVICAPNGREALEVYDAHRHEVALVITDVVMPEMGGEELAVRLKARDPGIRVVMMTGYPEEETGARGVGGVARTLKKPLMLGEIARVVSSELLSSSGPRG